MKIKYVNCGVKNNMNEQIIAVMYTTLVVAKRKPKKIRLVRDSNP